jgi:hypothetical protein
MPKKTKAASRSKASSRKPSKPAGNGSRTRKPMTREEKAEDAAFRIASVVRGDAVPTGAGGKLPSGATHELKGYDKQGIPIIQRRRFNVM